MDTELPGTVDESISSEPPVAASVRKAGMLRSFLWLICRLVCVAALAMGSYFIVSRYLLQSVTVVGVSMEPTLRNSQHYLLNRWIYCVRPPHRAEIVVLRDPADNGFSVKRVVAVCGDAL